MINNRNIDLTEKSDFSKPNPIMIHVKNGIMNHPRIPWKVNLKKSYLSDFYLLDGEYQYIPRYFDISFTSSSTNTFNLQYSLSTSTYTIFNNFNKYYEIPKEKDIFGLSHNKLTYLVNLRIPKEIRKNKNYSRRIPIELLKNEYDYNCYSFPDEIFKNYGKKFERKINIIKRIPWRDRNNSFIRVGERHSERGIVYYI